MLPPEIWDLIFSFLGPYRCIVRLVCVEWSYIKGGELADFVDLGDMKIVRYICGEEYYGELNEACVRAIKKGNLEMLKYLYSLIPERTGTHLAEACLANQKEIIEYLVRYNEKSTEIIKKYASPPVITNHKLTVEPNSYPPDQEAIEFYLRKGIAFYTHNIKDEKVLLWFLERGASGFVELSKISPEILHLCEKRNVRVHPHTYINVCSSVTLDQLERLSALTEYIPQGLYHHALIHKRYDIIEWLTQKRVPHDALHCWGCAGNVEESRAKRTILCSKHDKRLTAERCQHIIRASTDENLEEYMERYPYAMLRGAILCQRWSIVEKLKAHSQEDIHKLLCDQAYNGRPIYEGVKILGPEKLAFHPNFLRCYNTVRLYLNRNVRWRDAIIRCHPAPKVIMLLQKKRLL